VTKIEPAEVLDSERGERMPPRLRVRLRDRVAAVGEHALRMPALLATKTSIASALSGTAIAFPAFA